MYQKPTENGSLHVNNTSSKNPLWRKLLIDHFKDILFDEDAPSLTLSEDPQVGVLDQDISLDELKAASKILKAGKMPGIDILPNEMLNR